MKKFTNTLFLGLIITITSTHNLMSMDKNKVVPLANLTDTIQKAGAQPKKASPEAWTRRTPLDTPVITPKASPLRSLTSIDLKKLEALQEPRQEVFEEVIGENKHAQMRKNSYHETKVLSFSGKAQEAGEEDAQEVQDRHEGETVEQYAQRVAVPGVVEPEEAQEVDEEDAQATPDGRKDGQEAQEADQEEAQEPEEEASQEPSKQERQEVKKVKKAKKEKVPVDPVDRIKIEIKSQAQENLPDYCEQQLLAAVHDANIAILKHMVKKHKNLITPSMIANTIIAICNQLLVEKRILDLLGNFIKYLDRKRVDEFPVQDLRTEFREFIKSITAGNENPDITDVENLSLKEEEALDKYIAEIEANIKNLNAMIDYLVSNAQNFFTVASVTQEFASRKDGAKIVYTLMIGTVFLGKNTELRHILRTYGAQVTHEMLQQAEQFATARIVQLQIKRQDKAVLAVRQTQFTLQLFRTVPASVNTPDVAQQGGSCVIL